jgi:hypothetical protein
MLGADVQEIRAVERKTIYEKTWRKTVDCMLFSL